jgi:hypothetical protein
MFLGVSCFLELPARFLTPARSCQHLHKGWNEMLLKFGLGRFEASGTYGSHFASPMLGEKRFPALPAARVPMS